MKLKIKAKKEDFMYFGIFSIFLLYIVAVGVLNMANISSNGTLYGLNPAKAFSEEFIVYTLSFYILTIFAIFMMVSSHFFEREKGFGLSTDEKSDGFESWSKDKDIKESIGMKEVTITDKEYNYAGIPLLMQKNKMWVDDGESHSLIIGATGSGKTYFIVKPLVNILAKKGESMIITDPKGEIYQSRANFLRDKGYKIILLNFRNPQNGDSWNPLTLPHQLYKMGNIDKSNELIRDLAMNILHEEKTDDPFWQNSAADFFTGIVQGLFQDAKEEEINLNSVISVLTSGEEKYRASNYIKEYFTSKDVNNPAYINAAGTINAPDQTKGSIISVFRQKINIFAMAENLSEMLSSSNFNMLNIGDQKTAIFIVIHDEKKTYHALATIFVKQCYESLIDVAQNNGGKLPIRTNFILDEFANMPPLKDVTTMITAARSRQIRFNLIIQNFAQLNQVYGKENAETIKGNCTNTIYLLSSELQSLEEISKLCGEKKTKKKDKEEVRPLITVAELQRLNFKDAIILKQRRKPFKTKMYTDDDYNWNIGPYEISTYPSREKKPIQYFDLKGFVKSKAEANMFDISKQEKDFPFLNKKEDEYKIPKDLETESFNFDEIIKKIDAKIAELEEDEKAEVLKNNPVIEEPKVEEMIENPNIEKIIEAIEKEQPEEEYFDDFFDDEE